MALQTLSKSGITNNQTIQAWHVSQSVDAFTGTEGYAITLSGSFTFSGATTGSGWFQNAVSSSRAESVKVTNNATTNQNFRLLFALESGLPNPNADGYAQPRFDSGSDGSGLYYNPSIDTLYASKISGSNNGSTPDFFGTASYAVTASYALNTPTVLSFNYIGINDVTNSSSASPFPIQGNTPYNIYVSQSVGTSNELSLAFSAGTDGQIVNFTSIYRSAGYLLIAGGIGQPTISITSSVGVSVFGTNGNTLGPNSSAFLNTLGVNTPRNLTFQYVSTPSGTIFPAAGWYLININEN